MFLAGVAGGGYYYFLQCPNVTVPDKGIIFIMPGDSFETVKQLLLDKKYIRNIYTFTQVAELKKYPQSIKAGRYRILDGMNNKQLINMLRSGRQEAVRFTFNNIRTLEDFAGTLSRQLAIDSGAFLKITRNPEYVKKLGFTPDTGKYEVDERFDERDLIFYKSVENEGFIEATPGCYSIFFPADVHRPAVAVDEPMTVRKVVVKVSVALLSEE